MARQNPNTNTRARMRNPLSRIVSDRLIFLQFPSHALPESPFATEVTFP